MFFDSSTIISPSAPSQLGKDSNRREKITDAIFVGTLDGVFKVARSNGDWRVASKDLLGMEVKVLAAQPAKCDYYIDRWDEFAKKLTDEKAAIFTIWFRER
jgi:hypothetical protein